MRRFHIGYDIPEMTHKGMPDQTKNFQAHTATKHTLLARVRTSIGIGAFLFVFGKSGIFVSEAIG